jgi:hypothetical protein
MKKTRELERPVRAFFYVIIILLVLTSQHQTPTHKPLAIEACVLYCITRLSRVFPLGIKQKVPKQKPSLEKRRHTPALLFMTIYCGIQIRKFPSVCAKGNLLITLITLPGDIAPTPVSLSKGSAKRVPEWVLGGSHRLRTLYNKSVDKSCVYVQKFVTLQELTLGLC